MATGKVLLLNLKAYPQYGQLPSNSRHDCSPVPSTVMIINRPHYCTTCKRKLLTCSSSTSKVSPFVIANTMAASSEMLLTSTAEQPIYKGGSCVSSTTLFHADQTTLDAGSSLLFVVENILKHAAHMADTALLGTKNYLEMLDEKVSKANFSLGLLCTIKQFFAMDKEIALWELLVLAQKISLPLNLQEMQIVLCNKQIIETPMEIVKAFTGPIFAEDNLQPAHTDGSANKMISIVMAANDPLGEVKHQNAFAFSANPNQNPAFRPVLKKATSTGPTPGSETIYTFYYASMNKAWLDEFYRKATVVTTDLSIKNSIKKFSIKLVKIADHVKEREVQLLSKKHGWHEKCPKFLHNDQFSSYTGHFALLKNNSEVVLQDRGVKILKALGDFEGHWKKNFPTIGFRRSLLDYYKKLHN